MATPPVLQPVPAGQYGGWHVFWLCWLWNLEKFTPGQPIGKWTVVHFWFIAILALLFLWLLFHFALGWWRG